MAEWSKLTFPSPQLLVHAVGCRFESFQWLMFVYLYSIFTSKKLSHPSSPSSRMRSCPSMVKVLCYLRWLVFVALWLLNTVCLRVYLFWLELLRSIWVMPDSIPELLPLQYTEYSIWSAKPMSHHMYLPLFWPLKSVILQYTETLSVLRVFHFGRCRIRTRDTNVSSLDVYHILINSCKWPKYGHIYRIFLEFDLFTHITSQNSC